MPRGTGGGGVPEPDRPRRARARAPTGAPSPRPDRAAPARARAPTARTEPEPHRAAEPEPESEPEPRPRAEPEPEPPTGRASSLFSVEPSTEPPAEPARDPDDSGEVELPHWTEPATGEVPRVIIGDDADEGSDDAWAAFAANAPRWRNSSSDYGDDDDLRLLADDESGDFGPPLEIEEDYGFDELDVDPEPRPAPPPASEGRSRSASGGGRRASAGRSGRARGGGGDGAASGATATVPVAVGVGVAVGVLALVLFWRGPAYCHGPGRRRAAAGLGRAVHLDPPGRVPAGAAAGRGGLRGLPARGLLARRGRLPGPALPPRPVRLPLVPGRRRRREPRDEPRRHRVGDGVRGRTGCLRRAPAARPGRRRRREPPAGGRPGRRRLRRGGVLRRPELRRHAPVHGQSHQDLGGRGRGAIASLLVSVVVVGAVGGISVFGAEVVNTVYLAVVVVLAGTLGDLAESTLKRDLGVEDMGSILPGHGGILDRFDGILFALPAAYYLAQILR
ncbi:MAG: phosphatidate cytidylyltransferase [Acidimicrobiia bacterium]|nr:phosphatidate cytidylyltransferase [Acidimicrobiia bacterium]